VLVFAVLASLGSASKSSQPSGGGGGGYQGGGGGGGYQQPTGGMQPQVGPWYCSTTTKELTLTFCLRSYQICDGTMANMRQKGYQTTPCQPAGVAYCFMDRESGSELCMAQGPECQAMTQAMNGSQCMEIRAQ
jgi:hypothetical protein